MYSFLLCLLALLLGYLFYGRLMERLFRPDGRQTPVQLHEDGVDYIRLPRWKIFMIQFLNIAGLGPIFGAILGAKFGVSCFLWIVLGSIFAGATHDYLAAMISLRHGGESLPESVGRYLGRPLMRLMLVFSVVLLILVGVVFVASPATILAAMTPASLGESFWVIVIFVYYFAAAVLPIDKIIGRVYPLFAIALLFMAFGLLVVLCGKWPELPELWDGLGNAHPQADSFPLFPVLFVSVACGAISGFHATQSPMMCRCIQREADGRPIFYGAMIVEGVVALIWAAVATYFFRYGAMEGATEPYAAKPALVVKFMSEHWLGTLGGLLAVLGVVAAPITTGDTALRSARLIIADALHIDQSRLSRRLAVSVSLFVVCMAILLYSLTDKEGFDKVWRYFSWANQTLAVFTLWMITVYLSRRRLCCYPALLPAVFMTAVSSTYFCVGGECLGLPLPISCAIGLGVTLTALICFVYWRRWGNGEQKETNDNACS